MADDAVLNDLAALGHAARRAQRILALAPTAQKNRALEAMVHRLRKHAPDIAEANAEDVRRAREAGMREALIDRLRLDSSRIDAIAGSIAAVRRSPIPWVRPWPNGGAPMVCASPACACPSG
jgi:glutamate-5-semialdehyde dehydrogenase